MLYLVARTATLLYVLVSFLLLFFSPTSVILTLTRYIRPYPLMMFSHLSTVSSPSREDASYDLFWLLLLLLCTFLVVHTGRSESADFALALAPAGRLSLDTSIDRNFMRNLPSGYK